MGQLKSFQMSKSVSYIWLNEKALQLLRRLRSIFISVYAAVQKLKKAFENKFDGDNTPIVIQPPCYSASKVKIDKSDLTMKEYIELQTKKAQRREETFNWETIMYGKVCCDDHDSFIDFEIDFPAIVYNDASTSYQNVSSEPT
nr:hypothetical protein [Tanacetum cinerariifolium]